MLSFAKFGAVALLLALSTGLAVVPPARSAPVTVDFTGAVDHFNFGPLTPDTPLYGQLVLDDTVTATGGSISTFTNVILSFSLTVQEAGGDVVFAGSGGRVQQFSSSSGTTEYVQIGLGGLAGGTIGGSVNGTSITSFGLDLRGPDLYDDPTVLAAGLTTGDFNYRYLTLHFDVGGVAGLAVDRSLETLTFSGTRATAIAAPPAGTLLILGATALVHRRRRRRNA